jgi:uncharacterized membrane protein YbaN (DUF454 family)
MDMQQEPETNNKTKTSQKLVRALFFVAGTVSLSLGAIGIVLPVLPTTPFLLLALACYCRSSQRMTHWMLTNRYFGKYIQNYKEGKGIPLKTKLFAITVLWIAIGYSAIFIIPILIVQIILFAVAAAVTLHMTRLPTYRH